MTAPVLDRLVFTTSRLAEFCSERELINQTGHDSEDWPLVILKEFADNALDAAEEAGVAPVIMIEVTDDGITVTDNGPGIAPETVANILDYNTRTSSREAYCSPTRGAQGNALKTLLAMPFAISGERGETTIESHGVAHRITFSIDPIRQEPRIVRVCETSFSYTLGGILPSGYIVNHEIFSETIFSDRSETAIKKRSGSPQSGRIKRVCRCCNNGWMSVLQEDTKPILLPLVLGEVSYLHKNNQSKLAAWIAMFTMVSEFIDKTETRIGIPATDRLWLKEKQTVPANWKIWIGNYQPEKWKGVWLHSTIPIKSEKFFLSAWPRAANQAMIAGLLIRQ